MDNVKGKMFTLVGIVLVIAVFFLVFWLLFYQESVYYTQIDNEKVKNNNRYFNDNSIYLTYV